MLQASRGVVAYLNIMSFPLPICGNTQPPTKSFRVTAYMFVVCKILKMIVTRRKHDGSAKSAPKFLK